VCIDPWQIYHKMALWDIEELKLGVHEVSQKGWWWINEFQYSFPCHWANLEMMGAQFTPSARLSLPP
jgi:hypothetical protein